MSVINYLQQLYNIIVSLYFQCHNNFYYSTSALIIDEKVVTFKRFLVFSSFCGVRFEITLKALFPIFESRSKLALIMYFPTKL